MHDLLEGVVPQIIKLVLRTFVKHRKFFNCNTCNDRLKNFDYGPVETQDKPCANFSLHKLSEKGNKLKQTAAQTWILLRVFPFILNGLIPEQENMLDLIVILQKICFVCFSSMATHDMIDGLEFNIKASQQRFKELFPGTAAINKLHHLSHYANNARATSIPNDYSCMRFEALNKLPKSQIKNAQNYINVPLSLAKRLNLKQISAIVTRSFSQRVDIVSQNVVRKENTPHNVMLVNFPANLHHVKHLIIDGIHFKPHAVIKYDDETNSPQYGIINSMYYIDSILYFVINCLETVRFSEQYNSYHVTNTDIELLLSEEKNIQYLDSLRFRRLFHFFTIL